MPARFLVSCALLLISAQAWAQSPRSQAEQFLGTLQRGQIAAAFTKLFEGSNISSGGAGQGIIRRTEAMLPPHGRVLGHELIEERQFAGTVTRLVYILRSERHLTMWEFYFYRPGNRWFLAEVNLSENLNLLGGIR